MSIPVLLTMLDRPKALTRTLWSLAETAGPDINLVVQDDGSTDRSLAILESVMVSISEAKNRGKLPKYARWIEDACVMLLGPLKGGDPNRARRRILESVFERLAPEAPFVVTIESDLVFHRDWLHRLLELYEVSVRQPDGPLVLDGEPLATLSPYRGHAYRAREHVFGSWARRVMVGGVCHLITRWWYEKGKEPQGWMAWERRVDGDWPDRSGGWDMMMSRQALREGLGFGVLVPSLVDHDSGEEGGTSGSKLAADRAVDFAPGP